MDGGALVEARALGWVVEKVELAADFVGLVFRNDDSQLFTGRRSKLQTIRSAPGVKLGVAETIDVATRGKNRVGLTTHDKSLYLGRLGTDPGDSVYAPVWTEQGWDGGADVRRVEVRAHGGALRIRPRNAGDGPAFDLTDPAALLDPERLGAFWCYATESRRLVQAPADGVLDHLALRATDDRWTAVQMAGVVRLPARYSLAVREACAARGPAQRRRVVETRVAAAVGHLLALLRAEHGSDYTLDEVVASLRNHGRFVEEAELSVDFA